MDSGEIIDWSAYFDRIYCIHSVSVDNRIPRLEKELERVGILHSPIFQYRFTFPTRYDACILEKCPESRTSYVNLSMETLRILNESLYLGHKRIMIIEDDIAFLKDIGEIKSILDDIPDGYGIVQLDKGIQNQDLDKWERDLETRKINDHFVSSTHNFVYATCNVYTEEGMKDAIDSLEKNIIAPDFITKEIKKPVAVAIRNIGIQVLYDKACNMLYGPPDRLLRTYRSYGLETSDYSVPEGYVGRPIVPEKVKTLVTTRLLSNPLTLTDEQLLEPDRIRNVIALMKSNMIPSLENQTDLDFDLVVIIHDRLGEDMEKYVLDEISSEKFKVRLSRFSQFWTLVRDEWEDCDILNIVRMDADDFMPSSSKKRISVPRSEKEVSVHGYIDGYVYYDSDKKAYEVSMKYGNDGTFSAFQTHTFRTKGHELSDLREKLGDERFFNGINPNMMNHTRPIKHYTTELGLTSVELFQDRTPGSYVYFRHDTAMTIDSTDKFRDGHEVSLDKATLGSWRRKFGFNAI